MVFNVVALVALEEVMKVTAASFAAGGFVYTILGLSNSHNGIDLRPQNYSNLQKISKPIRITISNSKCRI